MAIIRTKYEADSGNIYKIRLDSAKAAITGNGAPAGAISDLNVEVQVSFAGRKRKYGIHPRGVYFSRVGTGADLNKVFRVFIPALTPGAFDTLKALTTLTYKTQTYALPDPVAEV